MRDSKIFVPIFWWIEKSKCYNRVEIIALDQHLLFHPFQVELELVLRFEHIDKEIFLKSIHWTDVASTHLVVFIDFILMVKRGDGF